MCDLGFRGLWVGLWWVTWVGGFGVLVIDVCLGIGWVGGGFLCVRLVCFGVLVESFVLDFLYLGWVGVLFGVLVVLFEVGLLFGVVLVVVFSVVGF